MDISWYTCGVKLLKLLIVPVFWIGVTYVGIIYGPKILSNLKDGKPIFQPTNKQNGDTANNILGENSNDGAVSEKKPLELPPPPKSVQEIPDYAREVAKVAAEQAVQTGSTAVQETTDKITENVCQQIILELQKQCGVTITTPEVTSEPTKSE